MEDGDTDGDNYSDRHSDKLGNGIVHAIGPSPALPVEGGKREGVNKESEPVGFALFIY